MAEAGVDKPLRIVLYSHTFLPTVGGRELVVHHLAKGLRELGARVRVVGPTGWRGARWLGLPYPVHRWPTLLRGAAGVNTRRGRWREREMGAQLRLDLALFGADVVHSHTTWPNGYLAARLGRAAPLRVITPHGIDVHMIPHLGHGLRLDPLLERRIRHALEQADAVTAISDSIAESALAAGAPRERLHRIDNGVDVQRFAEPPEIDVRARLGLRADARILLSVGNYHPRKGQAVLVRSMVAVARREPRARAVIVGRGTEALRPLVRELGLESFVVLPGALPFPSAAGEEDLLAALLAQAEGYVSASTEEGAEGLSLAVLEAMAAGAPVVATDISGNRDVVRTRENGLLVRPAEVDALADGLLALLADPGRRDAWAAAARATARRYAWRDVAAHYLALYRRLLRERGAATADVRLRRARGDANA